MDTVSIGFDLETGAWKPTRHEGVSIKFLRGDKTTGDATVLIRMNPGCGYPQHRHVGEEEVLVLAGGYKDHHGTYRKGEYHVNKAGSVHHPVALPDGVCILFAVAHGGIELIEGGDRPKAKAEPQFRMLIDRWADHPRVREWHARWMERTAALCAKYRWLRDREALRKLKPADLADFLKEETSRKTMRWPLGILGLNPRKILSTPNLAYRLDALLWSDEPLEARVDAALSGPHALGGSGSRSIALPSLLLQTAFPDKVVGLLSQRFGLQAFPLRTPPGATPGENFALMSRTVAAAWKTARPDKPLNLAHWVLWMEYASHHPVRVSAFKAEAKTRG